MKTFLLYFIALIIGGLINMQLDNNWIGAIPNAIIIICGIIAMEREKNK